MGYSLQADERPAEEFASVGGMRELRALLLKRKDHPEFDHLVNHGWTDEVGDLRDEAVELKKHADANVSHTLDAILAATAGDPQVVSITDGLGPHD